MFIYQIFNFPSTTTYDDSNSLHCNVFTMIIEPLKALIFSILNSIPYVGSALMAKGITNVKYIDHNCRNVKYYPTISDGFMYLIGLSTPFLKFTRKRSF